MAYKKVKQKTTRRTPISEEELHNMLFWYTYFEGNCNKVAKKVNHGRTTVWRIAKRNNFDAQAHIMKDEIARYMSDSGDRNPNVVRIRDMGLNLLQIDVALVSQAKDYILGTLKQRAKSKIRSMSEALKMLQYAESSVTKLTGVKDIRGDSLDQTAKDISDGIAAHVSDYLSQLSEEGRKELATRLRITHIEGEFRDLSEGEKASSSLAIAKR